MATVQELISFLSTVFLVIFQINQLTNLTNAATIRRITETVRLEEKDWFHHLLNPCNHDNPENHSPQEVLRVSGRETEIRTIVGTTLARLRGIEQHLSGPVSNFYYYLNYFKKVRINSH